MKTRKRKRSAAVQRTRYFDLTPGIRRQMREIRKNLRAIEQSTFWSTHTESNKAFARMCADLIIVEARCLYREFEDAGIGFRDGVPLIISYEKATVPNDQA